jgi:SHS2 domain-containing protein
MERRTYMILEHEADMGLLIFGRTEEELFANAVKALFSLMIDTKALDASVKKQVSVADGDELLIVFLNELLYLFDVEGFVPKKLTSVQIADGKVHAEMNGGVLDRERHVVKREIKAVTYHGFSVEKEGALLRARIIIDV